MDEQSIAERAEQWRDAGEQLFAGMRDAWLKSNTADAAIDLFGTIVGKILGTTYVAMAPIGLGFADAMSKAEDTIAPAFSNFAARGVNDVFGTSISPSQFARSSGPGRATSVGAELGRALMAQMQGTTGPLQPSRDAAEKYVGILAGQAVEDWFKGWFFEVLSSLIPQLDVGKVEAYAALGDKVTNVLGLGRVSQRVLRPVVETTIVTPFQWHINKTYRPTLLSASQVQKQLARERYTRDEAIEELARQGYSDRRIELLLAESAKQFTAAEVRTFVERKHWSSDAGLRHLQDQGYTHTGAQDALRLGGLRRFEQLEDQEAGLIVAAYADRRIDRPTFTGLLSTYVQIDTERALFTELGDLRRQLNTRSLSVSEVRAAVKAGILNVTDYRRALDEDGYDPESVTVLELLLRHELDAAADLVAARKRIAEERAAEKARRDAERAARLVEIERARAAAQRGPTAAIEQAAIRGLVPLARVAELYAQDYDAETVGILSELLEDRRLAYVAQQAARDEAKRRAARRAISVADLEAGVKAGLLTIADYRGALGAAGFDAADADLLAATLDAEIAARAEAKRRRDEAAAAAGRRSIDLGRFERLVRRGARTLAQYEQLLAGLGFDDGSIAGMRELLQLQIDDDARARALRESAEDQLRPRGLSLAQFRRGVLLGVKTAGDYERFLVDQNFTADAIAVLMAELREDLAEADAARAQRAAADARVGDRALPLATVRRAARLGVIAPETYAARLVRDGYAAEDMEIDLELLLLEIAEVQADRVRRDEAELAARARGLSLLDTERAVRAGVLQIEDYRARAVEAGYAIDAANLLTALLAQELALVRDARGRRGVIEQELAARSLSLGQLEEAVIKGLRTVDQFYADVLQLGYGSDDAELLVGLLLADLERAAGDQGEG